MSLDPRGSNCARCKSYLFAEDDIVYCPVCGAPHHRDCYNALGHCALEELHGTPQQYSRTAREEQNTGEQPPVQDSEKDKTVCRICGEKYDKSLNRCPKCNTPKMAGFGGVPPIDMLGGVPADLDLGDGVTAEEAKKFVFANTYRYIPKFASLNPKNRVSWNWLALICPSPWFFSRKMYKAGIITGALSVAASLFAYPFSHRLYTLGISSSASYMQIANQLSDRISEIGNGVLIFAIFSLLCTVLISVFSALFGDYIYKKHAIRTIKKIKAESTDIDTDFHRKGGVSFLWFLLILTAVQYLPSLIAVFL